MKSRSFTQWVESVPEEITTDALWKMKGYRVALFIADVGWHDITRLIRDKRTIGLSDQLYRALGSISSNISEGYSRSSGRDRARFYEYALGSARESRNWYFTARHVLKAEVIEHRIALLTEIIKLLLTMIPRQRSSGVREGEESYLPSARSEYELDGLLAKIPH